MNNGWSERQHAQNCSFINEMISNKLRKAKRKSSQCVPMKKCSYLNPIITTRTENIASQLQLGTSFASPAGAAEQKCF